MAISILTKWEKQPTPLFPGTSLVVQWLRLHAPDAGGPGFDYVKVFDCVDYNKLWKILKAMWIPDHLTFLLRNLYQVKKQQLEPDMEQQTGSK